MTTPEQWEQWNGAVGRFRADHDAHYDRRVGRLTGRLLAALPLQPRHRVLDVGCGCGQTTRLVAALVPDGSARGVDLSTAMVARARGRAAEAGLGNVAFDVADVQETPPRTSGYDLVISRLGVMFFDDPRAAFTGLRQALRPGGRLLFVCWRRHQDNQYRTVQRAVLGEVVPLPPLRDVRLPGPFSLSDPDHLRDLLGSAGFGDVRLEPLDEPLWAGDTAEDAALFAVREPATQALLEPAGPQAVERAAAGLRLAFVPYQTPNGVLLGSAAWLVSGTAG